jgi:hypothetical protein
MKANGVPLKIVSGENCIFTMRTTFEEASQNERNTFKPSRLANTEEPIKDFYFPVFQKGAIPITDLDIVESKTAADFTIPDKEFIRGEPNYGGLAVGNSTRTDLRYGINE